MKSRVSRARAQLQQMLNGGGHAERLAGMGPRLAASGPAPAERDAPGTTQPGTARIAPRSASIATGEERAFSRSALPRKRKRA
jgi:hypothetical protein